MNRLRGKIYGQFNYADSLSYDELMTAEEALMDGIKAVLQQSHAAHQEFTPAGDLLHFHCALDSHELARYRHMAHDLAALLPGGVTGRLLCLDACLASDAPMYCFWMQPGQWQEAMRLLPLVPPEALATWPASPMKNTATSP